MRPKILPLKNLNTLETKLFSGVSHPHDDAGTRKGVRLHRQSTQVLLESVPSAVWGGRPQSTWEVFLRDALQ